MPLMLPRDEQADAERLEEWQTVRRIAFRQAAMAHNRACDALEEGHPIVEGVHAETACEWAYLWKDMTDEEQEAEVDAALMAAVEAKAITGRKGKQR